MNIKLPLRMFFLFLKLDKMGEKVKMKRELLKCRGSLKKIETMNDINQKCIYFPQNRQIYPLPSFT